MVSSALSLGFHLGVGVTTHIEDLRQFMRRVRNRPPRNGFLDTDPRRIDPYEVGAVVAMSFGLSFLATLYPSLRGELNPVEALRYE